MCELVVTKTEQIPEAIEELKKGKSVTCHPIVYPQLEFEVLKVGLNVKIEDDFFCYEFIPIKGEGSD